MPSAFAPPLIRFDPPRETTHRLLSKPFVLVGLIVIALSFTLDKPLATFLHDRRIDDGVKFSGLPVHVVKLAGLIWYTVIVAVIVAIAHPLHWRAGVYELFCGIAAGLNYPIKWIAGRIRPFKLPPLNVAQPFHFSLCAGGWHGFMNQWDLSFVSGHVAVAFATAAGLDQLLPTHRLAVWIGYAIAFQLLAERVLENAHWLSDTTCAAALGIGAAALLARMTKLRQRIKIYG